MLQLIRRHWRVFGVLTVSAFALRLLFIRLFPFLAGDSSIYGEIALTWLKHGIYGVMRDQGPTPTMMRVPGYPAFLALIFKVFGPEHYGAAMYVQAIVDIGTCFIVADLARRIGGARAALWAFAIAALCPFTANYVATPLTETLCIFFTALSFDFGVAVFTAIDEQRKRVAIAFGCGLAICAAIYLRPDSGLLLIAIGLPILAKLIQDRADTAKRRVAIAMGIIVLVVSLVPLTPWTLRNWRTFHLFQPLAPFAATDPDEPVDRGFNRWVHTWLAEYASLEDFVWSGGDQPANFDVLPARACDNAAECDEVRRLIDEWNASDGVITDDVDAAFGRLAAQRSHTHPLRQYVWLPALRTADLWLRPRIEMLPLGIHWWRFHEDPRECAIALAYAALNLALLLAALAGALLRPKYACALIAYIVVRTVFLVVIGAVESRYTIECYPALFVLAAYWITGKTKAQHELGSEG